MDQIFDRLGNLLKSFVRDDSDDLSDSRKASFGDPDLQDAWEELDDFLKTGKKAEPREQAGAAGTASTSPPPELAKDYQTLEVPFGSHLPDVAKSYKRLLRQHHPDRHATDAAASAKATEKTKLLTSAFRRIRQYVESGKFS